MKYALFIDWKAFGAWVPKSGVRLNATMSRDLPTPARSSFGPASEREVEITVHTPHFDYLLEKSINSKFPLNTIIKMRKKRFWKLAPKKGIELTPFGTKGFGDFMTISFDWGVPYKNLFTKEEIEKQVNLFRYELHCMHPFYSPERVIKAFPRSLLLPHTKELNPLKR